MRLKLPTMGSRLLPATIVHSQFAELVTSTKEERDVKLALSAKPATSASKVALVIS